MSWPGTMRVGADDASVEVLDQRLLPHGEAWLTLRTLAEARAAITGMAVRGAGLIGNVAAYGMWLAALETVDDFSVQGDAAAFLAAMRRAAESLKTARPTAGNLAWAVERQLAALERAGTARDAILCLRSAADALARSEAEACRGIGRHGRPIIEALARPGAPVNILTHCNAGKLAFVDWGSALAPVYAAHEAGIALHVWVDETRPRNQGAQLTAWELAAGGVPHSLIADNAGGHLMRRGLVDMVIVGADRVTRRGDVANKIGTYLKALAARDNNIPFYVALPSSTFDLALLSGDDIPIEERDGEEVRRVSGKTRDGEIVEVLICPEATPARNWAFDVTPAALVTAFVCECGVCKADEAAIAAMLGGAVR
ncbi:MAG: S-methyl-5-thioribose-1-phosphate isomerase [Desulfovibrio sp.]|jgi:methylthioribose-1-phosphate isomerase|nr:S-methyl-5-thioribose-1-phosphate isomerase [Desulfovibrio sp.]